MRRLAPVAAAMLLLVGMLLVEPGTRAVASACLGIGASAILAATVLRSFTRTASLLRRAEGDHQVALSALRDEYAFTQAMLQSVPDGVIATDSTGTVLQVSPRWCDITGYSADDVVGLLPPYPWWPPDKIATRVIETAAIRAATTSTDMTTRIRRSDGMQIEVRGTMQPVLGAGGEVRILVGTIRDLTEINRVEAERQRLAEQITVFFDLSTDLMCIAGSDGYFKRLNPAWERTLGFTEAELTARPYVEFIHPDDVERTSVEALEQATAGKVSISFENRYRCSDGSYRWLTWNAIPQGEWIYAAARDTTAERLASQNQARLAGIVDSTADAVISKTMDGTITSWNPAAERIYGYRADEVIGNSIKIIFFADEDDILEGVARGESLTDLQRVRRHKDGSRVHIGLTVSPIRDHDGTIIGASSIARDISARHEADQRFRRLVQSAPDAMIISDSEGNIVLANEQVERLFGYAGAELIGQPVEMLVPPRARDLHREHRRTFNDDPAIRQMGAGMELSGIRRDGTEFPIDISMGPLETAEGTLVSASIRDASGRKQIERDLAQARDEAREATSAKSAFLATMSHEIRTPLNAVIGMTGLLLDTELDEEQADFIATVRDSGDALLSVINNVLDFSKIESSELDLEVQPFDLRDCVESALSLLALPASRKGLELVAQLGETCPELVIGDVTRFRQVIVNLLANAVKFVNLGEVVLTVSAQPLTGRGPGATLLSVAVRDTGIGIAPERMHRLFQPFSQVDSSTTRIYGGSGLGLVISRRLAQAMGGDLQVTSEVGAGSTFTFTAQLQVASDRRASIPGEGAKSLTGRSVLIVDDNAANRQMLELLLGTWGMRVTTSSSAGAALELLSGEVGTAHFDVAIFDMHMPHMDGVRLAVAVRLLPGGTELPLILLSSLPWRPTADQRALFEALLTKPVRSATLQEKLVAALAPLDAILTTIETAGGTRGSDGPAAPARALRILVAEDNLVNQKVAQALLMKLGHRADMVADGLEAVQALRTVPYDVVLMDMQMPELDGPGATRRIRAELPAAAQPFIVALTANVSPEDRATCLTAGMDAFLTKPFKLQELRDVLTRHYLPGGSRDRERGEPSPPSLEQARATERLRPAQPAAAPTDPAA